MHKRIAVALIGLGCLALVSCSDDSPSVAEPSVASTTVTVGEPTVELTLDEANVLSCSVAGLQVCQTGKGSVVRIVNASTGPARIVAQTSDSPDLVLDSKNMWPGDSFDLRLPAEFSGTLLVYEIKMDREDGVELEVLATA